MITTVERQAVQPQKEEEEATRSCQLAAAMAIPGTEPFSLSSESPRLGERSTSSGPMFLSRGSRNLGEASVLVSKTLHSFQDSGSSSQATATTDPDSQHQTSSTVIFFTAVCLLLFVTLLSAYINARRIRAADLVIGCRTAECKLASGYLSTLLDRDVQPCDDFYQHVCGKWTKDRDGVSFLGDTFQQFLADLRRRLIAASPSSVSPNLRGSLLVGKHFVHECLEYMDDAGPGIKVEVHSLLDVLSITTILKSENTFDAVLQALALSFTTGLAAVVEIRRRRLEGRVYLHILNARPIREELMPEASDRAIEVYLEDVIEALSGNRRHSEVMASSLVILDNALAQVAHTVGTDDDVWLQVADLMEDARFPEGLWDVALSLFKATEPVQGQEDAVLFTGLNAARLTARRLVQSPLNVTSHYLVAVVLSKVLRFDFLKRFGSNYPYRSEHLCLDAATRALGPEWPVVLFQLAFEGVNLSSVQALFERLRSAAMVTPDWMDNATADKTREKLQRAKLTSFASGFDKTTPQVSLGDPLAVTLNHTFLASYVLLYKQAQEGSIRSPPDGLKSMLSYTELRGRVIYRDLYHAVFLPLVYMRHPILYSPMVASYYNYGTLGPVIAKELAEAVSPFSRADGTGGGRDARSSSGNVFLWSNESRREFAYRIGCYRAFEDQFHKGRPQDVDRLTVEFQRNLFAWLRAARVSYEAMKADFESMPATRDHPALWKSAQKVFFQRFCLVACGLERTEPLSAKERCHWPLLNMVEFVDSFGCPNNSFMASRQKCHFF